MNDFVHLGKGLLKKPVEWFSAGFGPHRLSGHSPRLWILMYHRVLPANDARYQSEEPGMIVTPDTFRQQLQQLKQLFTVLPLAEWITRRAAGKPLPHRACAITFDDGWRDNFEYALPVLQQEQVPATLFAVSHMIGTTLQFWPNRLTRLLQLDERPAAAPQHGEWLTRLPGYRSEGSLSQEEIAALIAQSKRYSDVFLHEKLSVLEAEWGIADTTEPALMDWPQLEALQASGLVDIGSHTCHHCRLVEGLPADVLEQEIAGSRKYLEERLGRPVTLFCYPNGDVSPAAAALVGRHYQAAVTTRRGINAADSEAHTLLRLGIHEDIGNTPTRFAARLSGWL